MLGCAFMFLICDAAVAGVWRAPTDLPFPGVSISYPALAVDSNGRVVAGAVSSENRVMAARFVNGAWSGQEQISVHPSLSGSLKMVVDGSGVATAAWVAWDSQAGSQRVFAARREGGTWTTPIDLSAQEQRTGWGQTTVSHVDLAADANGNVFALWYAYDNSGQRALLSSRYSSGAWAVPTTLSTDYNCAFLNIVADPNGVVTAAWVSNGAPNSLKAARFSAGAWSTPATVATTTYNVGALHVEAEPRLSTRPVSDNRLTLGNPLKNFSQVWFTDLT
jgi:hypothetical protein